MGCCCRAETTSEGSSLCAAPAVAALAAKERQMRGTFPLLRPTHYRPLESSPPCKMVQVGLLQVSTPHINNFLSAAPR